MFASRYSIFYRSLVLLMQSAVPTALFSTQDCQLTFGGGTNAENAPPIDYFIDVFKPMVKAMGIQVDCELLKRCGFIFNFSLRHLLMFKEKIIRYTYNDNLFSETASKYCEVVYILLVHLQ